MNLDHISEEEIQSLKATTSEAEWNAACKLIKSKRNDKYPKDWFAKVLQSGLMDRIAAKWGGSSEIKIETI